MCGKSTPRPTTEAQTKRKVGDKVIIRNDLVALDKDYTMEIEKDSVNVVNDHMMENAGKEATIIGFTWHDQYMLDIDDGDWSWTDEMFESEQSVEAEVK